MCFSFLSFSFDCATHTAPNALGETDVLRERWLREAFERAVSDTSASINEIDNTDETSSNALLNLDQDAAMALLKEINADLAASRIRQKMAVKKKDPFFSPFISPFISLFFTITFRHLT
jgi:hypothetical protein